MISISTFELVTRSTCFVPDFATNVNTNICPMGMGKRKERSFLINDKHDGVAELDNISPQKTTSSVSRDPDVIVSGTVNKDEHEREAKMLWYYMTTTVTNTLI